MLRLPAKIEFAGLLLLLNAIFYRIYSLILHLLNYIYLRGHRQNLLHTHPHHHLSWNGGRRGLYDKIADHDEQKRRYQNADFLYGYYRGKRHQLVFFPLIRHSLLTPHFLYTDRDN